MIATVLNAIYPPMLILMIGFFCSILFNVFLKHIVEDVPVRYALFYTFAWSIVSFKSVIKQILLLKP